MGHGRIRGTSNPWSIRTPSVPLSFLYSLSLLCVKLNSKWIPLLETEKTFLVGIQLLFKTMITPLIYSYMEIASDTLTTLAKSHQPAERWKLVMQGGKPWPQRADLMHYALSLHTVAMCFKKTSIGSLEMLTETFDHFQLKSLWQFKYCHSGSCHARA